MRHPGGWINVYRDQNGRIIPGTSFFENPVHAATKAGRKTTRVACVLVPPFQEGEGLVEVPKEKL